MHVSSLSRNLVIRLWLWNDALLISLWGVAQECNTWTQQYRLWLVDPQWLVLWELTHGFRPPVDATTPLGPRNPHQLSFYSIFWHFSSLHSLLEAKSFSVWAVCPLAMSNLCRRSFFLRQNGIGVMLPVVFLSTMRYRFSKGINLARFVFRILIYFILMRFYKTFWFWHNEVVNQYILYICILVLKKTVDSLARQVPNCNCMYNTIVLLIVN